MSGLNPSQTWQQILRQNFTKWELLADFLELNDKQKEFILTKSNFPLNFPLRLANKVPKGTLDDPILRQFLPTQLEKQNKLGFVEDPVGDTKCRKSSKLLHKYESRVLLVCTSVCAMNCRYCFRQKFDYSVGEHSFVEEMEIIAKDESIKEVLLSGGDPLSLPNPTLKRLLENISQIPHIKRIRFHTRFPIGIPERIDDEFIEMLQKVPKQIWFITHINHPRELDEDVVARLKLLQKQGIVLLNQAVLLKGVNDDFATLKLLCEKLVDNGIAPYYLHQLDKVEGAAHFEVSEEEGIKLMKALSSSLSGYAVPRYVREISGEPGKTILY